MSVAAEKCRSSRLAIEGPAPAFIHPFGLSFSKVCDVGSALRRTGPRQARSLLRANGVEVPVLLAGGRGDRAAQPVARRKAAPSESALDAPFHATHALENGAELTAVRDNHASIATTSVYLHSDDLKRARQIDSAFAAPTG